MKALLLALSVTMLLNARACSAEQVALVDAIRTNVRCGAASSTVAQLLSDRGEVRAEGADQLRVRRGNSHVLIRFRDRGARTIQSHTYHAASTGAEIGPEEDLCSGKKYGRLILNAPSELVNAQVYVDGVFAEELTSASSRIDVSWEPHEIRLEKEGWQPVIERVAFPGASGIVRLDVGADRLVRR